MKDDRYFDRLFSPPAEFESAAAAVAGMGAAGAGLGLQAMQDSPALVLPIVLMRLKQNEGEWKRAQRESNKILWVVDGELRTLVGSSGHRIQDDGQEGALLKGICHADRGSHGDADGGPCCAHGSALYTRRSHHIASSFSFLTSHCMPILYYSEKPIMPLCR